MIVPVCNGRNAINMYSDFFEILENLKYKIKFMNVIQLSSFEGGSVKCWYLFSFCEISSKEVALMFSVKRVVTCYILMCQLCDMAVTVRDVTFVAHSFKVFVTEVEVKAGPSFLLSFKKFGR